VASAPPSNNPPVVTVPADYNVEGNTTGGANVTAYTGVSATDIEDGAITPVCTPTLTYFFALGGPHQVSCTATDSGDLTDTKTFNIMVVDTTPPTLSGMPVDMTVEGNTLSGANVSWTDPTASDIVDPSPSVGCSPLSGSFFALGEPTTVTCTATDASGNVASASFDVTVVDTTPPSFSGVPADQTIYATGNSQAVATWTDPTASDIVWGGVAVSCAPPSGSTFNVGSTEVTCSATDGSGNSASASFWINVVYNFSGFFRPIDNSTPTTIVLNVAKAGSAIPVKFSLNGYQGMNIFMSGFPKSGSTSCAAASSSDAIEETVTAGQSSLNYDPLSDQYNYVWKTDKGWANSCRTLNVKTADGQDHIAYFRFTK